MSAEPTPSTAAPDTSPSTAPSSGGDREFDLVLVGATGFVGRLTAAHLARSAPRGMRIGLGGRSRSRLARTRADLPEVAEDWPLVVVDTQDEESVRDLAARTRAVVTTVGPFTDYGRLLVAACAAAGTHYADLAGEVLFVRDMIDQHDATARSTGARIVTSCGFDSVPSDLGVLLTAQRAAQDGEGTLERTTLHVRTLRGGMSSGTLESMRRQFDEAGEDPARQQIVDDPYALSPDRDREPDAAGGDETAEDTTGAGRGSVGGLRALLAQKSPVRRAGGSGRWEAPFFMADFNTRVVRRSNALTDWSYGRTFAYDEVVDTGAGALGAVGAAGVTAATGAMLGGMRFAPTRALLGRAFSMGGDGPSAESMEKGRFVIEVEATTTTGARYVTRVSADRDPGYTGTAVMLGESALALASGDDALPDRAGVLTPATGLGQALVDRLRRQGFLLTTERR